MSPLLPAECAKRTPPAGAVPAGTTPAIVHAGCARIQAGWGGTASRTAPFTAHQIHLDLSPAGAGVYGGR